MEVHADSQGPAAACGPESGSVSSHPSADHWDRLQKAPPTVRLLAFSPSPVTGLHCHARGENMQPREIRLMARAFAAAVVLD